MKVGYVMVMVFNHCACLILLTLFGCTEPSVKYRIVGSAGKAISNNIYSDVVSDKDGNPKFFLQTTNIVLQKRIVVDNDKSAEKNALPGMQGVLRGLLPKDKGAQSDAAAIANVLLSEVTVLSLPTESRANLIEIVPQTQWLGLVKTHLSISYADNTSLIRRIGSSVEDNRIKVIQAIGGGFAAVGGMGIVGFADSEQPAPIAELHLPIVIRFDSAEVDGRWRKLSGTNHKWAYRYADAADKDEESWDKGTTLAKTYFAAYDDEKWFNATRTFPLSACKDLLFELAYSVSEDSMDNHWRIAYGVRVADSSFVRAYALPPKGSINVHTACGADIVTEHDPANTTWEILAEAMKQAKAVYDATKADRNKGKESK
jgi:hypothetical protein